MAEHSLCSTVIHNPGALSHTVGRCGSVGLRAPTVGEKWIRRLEGVDRGWSHVGKSQALCVRAHDSPSCICTARDTRYRQREG